MKKCSSLVAIAICSIILSNHLVAQDSAEKPKLVGVSFGFGIPFGGQGINCEIYPIEYCGVNIGFGDYGDKVFALVGGFRILFPDQNSAIRLLLGGHYGTIGKSKEKLVIKQVGAYYDWSSAYATPTGITGTAFSVGARIRSQLLVFQNIDFGLILKRNYQLSNNVEEIKPWFAEFYVGAGFYF